MSYAAFLSEDRRLAILRLLHDQEGYALNESVIHDALERLGHHVPRSIARDDLVWLEERALLRVEVVGDRVWVATLTERGGDVATGRSRVEGVKRPSPRR